MNYSIILASASPYRRELLGRLRVAFEAWSPDVDERPLPREKPEDTARRLAHAKAEAGVRRWPQALIIGSDQVADVEGEAIGKPGTLEAARRQLARLSGRTVSFHTALCVVNAATSATQERLVTTEVAFRALGSAEIERYLDREDALQCAGSARAEGLGIALLERVRGDDPTALIGLPLIALSEMLRAEGIDVP